MGGRNPDRNRIASWMGNICLSLAMLLCHAGGARVEQWLGLGSPSELPDLSLR